MKHCNGVKTEVYQATTLMFIKEILDTWVELTIVTQEVIQEQPRLVEAQDLQVQTIKKKYDK
tara:strand:- start:458 stop:643 length:186 start_codon:yes stop_codon:yes gene_type:complete